jgi:hypothetical protein
MTVEKFLDPKNDFAFKMIFGTEKHKDNAMCEFSWRKTAHEYQ